MSENHWCEPNSTRQGFPYLGAIDILVVSFFDLGGCPLYCRMFSSSPGLYPDVSTTLSYPNGNKNVSRLCQMSLDRPLLRTEKIKYIKVFYLALAVENVTPPKDQILVFLIILLLITQ